MAQALAFIPAWATTTATSFATVAGITYGSVTGLAIASAAVALGTFAIASTALQALTKQPSATDAGSTLQTTKSNTDVVPLLYGSPKTAGNIIYETTNNYNGGTTNQDYWSVISLAEAELNAFLEIYGNENKLTDNGNDEFLSEYVQVKGYKTTGTGLALADITFVTDDLGATDTGDNIFSTISSVTVSSTSSTSSNLIDGNETTSWRPQSNDAEWIKFIDNDSTEVFNAKLLIKQNYSSNFEFKLQYSDDDSTWIDASEIFTSEPSFSTAKEWVTLNSTISTAHLYWRIFIIDISIDEVPNIGEIFELSTFTNKTNTITFPRNRALLAVHQKWSPTEHFQLDEIRAVVEGRLIRTVEVDSINETRSYSNNPVDIMVDIMVDYLTIGTDSIDIDSFYAAKQFCIANDLTCDIQYKSRQDITSALEDVTATFRGFLHYPDDSWKITFDGVATSVKTLGDSDILANSLQVGTQRTEDVADLLTLNYVNPEDSYYSATQSALIDPNAIYNSIPLTATDEQFVTVIYQDVLFREPDETGLNFWLSRLQLVSRLEVIAEILEVTDTTFKGFFTEKIIDVRGCGNLSQAKKLAELNLNQIRYSEDSEGNRILQQPLIVSFGTTFKSAELENGDVVTIQNSLFAQDKKFKIVSVTDTPSGAINFTAKEYFDTHFKNQAQGDLLT